MESSKGSAPAKVTPFVARGLVTATITLILLLFHLCGGGLPVYAQENENTLLDSILTTKIEKERLYEIYSNEYKRAHEESFKILGTIKDRNEEHLIIFGTAVPVDEDYSRMGTLLTEGNIEVFGPETKSIMGSTYGWNEKAYHRYIIKSYGVNAFGMSVPVYWYGALSATIYTLEQNYNDSKALFYKLVDDYLIMKRKSIRALHRSRERDSAKKEFISVLNENSLPNKKLDEWKQDVRVWLRITDEEISTGEVGEELANRFLEVAENFLKRQNYAKAREYVGKAETYEPNNPRYEEVRLECKKADDAINNARMESIRVIAMMSNARNHFREKQYKSAQKLLIDVQKRSPDQPGINDLWQDIEQKKLSPRLPMTLSLLPGAGQFYVKRYGMGTLYLFGDAFVAASLLGEGASENQGTLIAIYGLLALASMGDAYLGVLEYNRTNFLPPNVTIELGAGSKQQGDMISLSVGF